MENKLYYKINTYGCQMNVHESEKIAGMLEDMGYTSCDDEKDADIIVFNTCAIRDGAETKVLGNIGATKKLKKLKPDLIIAVCGCMTQQKARAELIKEKYPQVSIVFGTHNLSEFQNYLLRYKKDKKKIFELWDKTEQINEHVPLYRTSGYNAWVNIMYGCNNFCTYCIVPYVRGHEISRNFDDIICEVKELVSEGYATITLLGQNVNSYGNDIDDKNITFANLLKELDKIEGDYVLKFMTSHPKDLSCEVIDVIANSKHISHTIHLPVQSGNNRILKLMNRRYTIEHYKSLIDAIKQKISDAKITTDIIVGFPTETEEEFMDTYNLVKDVGYSGVFAFMYSPRAGTPASKMEGQIDDKTKHDRVNRLLKLSRQIIQNQSKTYVGNRYKALCTEKKGTNTICTLDCGKSVIVENSDIKPGKFYNILVNKLEKNMLYGTVCKD